MDEVSEVKPKHFKDKGRCPDCLSTDPAFCNMEHEKERDIKIDPCCKNEYHSYVIKEKKEILQ